jgi:glycosyltransferase involved in cell wall biosynthesis
VPDQYPDQSDALLYLEGEGFRVAIEDSLGLPLNPLAKMHEFYSGLDPLRTVRLLPRWRHYHAIITVGCAAAYFPVQVRWALRLGVPIIDIDPALSHNYPRRKRLQDVVLPLVDKVVVFGKVQLDYLNEEYGDRVDAVFLMHRVDTEFYHPGLGGGAAGSDRLILSVGNDLSRDFGVLIEALRSGELDGLGPRCHIHTTLPVDGNAPGASVHREHVSFLELRELYRKADVFVLPLQDLIHAGGINSLLEAMSMARPVVVSGSRGIRDYVVHGETALVVEPGDAAGMAQAIRRLLEDRDEARRLGENARRFVIENCRNEVYARNLGAVIREVIRAGRRTAAPGRCEPSTAPSF